MKLLLLTIGCLFVFFKTSDSFCCPWVVTQNVKCTCDDGTFVHPWECCSEGQCNIFCCNCGGPCKKNGTTEQAMEDLVQNRIKRDLGGVNHPALHFVRIDTNGDNVIDSGETLAHFGLTNSRPGFIVNSKMAQFAKMDVNRDGVIQPNEFEDDLTEKDVILARSFQDLEFM